MRHLAITGMDTVAMISRIFFGDAIRATPPSLRISAGTRSSAITAGAPAFSAMTACSALVTSIITPPLSISARPTLRRKSSFMYIFVLLHSQARMPVLHQRWGFGQRRPGVRALQLFLENTAEYSHPGSDLIRRHP